jgi:hypothetical protein
MNESRVGSLNESRVGGACGPPPPFVAPLVPRCALTSGATPRDVLAAAYGSAGPRRWLVSAPVSSCAVAGQLEDPCVVAVNSRIRAYLTIVKYPAASARPPGFLRKRSGGDHHATMCAAPAAYYARLVSSWSVPQSAPMSVPIGRERRATARLPGRQHVAGGRPGSECAARNERSNERGRGAAGSPDPALV